MGYDAYQALLLRQQNQLIQEQNELMRAAARTAAGESSTSSTSAFGAQVTKTSSPFSAPAQPAEGSGTAAVLVALAGLGLFVWFVVALVGTLLS